MQDRFALAVPAVCSLVAQGCDPGDCRQHALLQFVAIITEPLIGGLDYPNTLRLAGWVEEGGLVSGRDANRLLIGIFAINVYMHRHVLDAFMFSLALAVGLIPQLLPAISVNLPHGEILECPQRWNIGFIR
jgi:hypothetical protein